MTATEKTNKLVMTALMMCMILLMTMFFKVPIPFTTGYVHLGDAMIFLAVLLLGWKWGAIAAAVGSALGDILGGFAIWAPWTFAIKGGMALIMGLLIAQMMKRPGAMIFGVPAKQLIGMILGGIFMVAGYYVAEGFIYGNWIAPLIGIPWNIGQFVVGMVIATALVAALYKTPARKFFTYNTAALKTR